MQSNKIYVDTVIINHILENSRNSFTLEEAEALAWLTTNKGVQFILTTKVQEEIEKILDKKRKYLLTFLVHLVKKGKTYSETFQYSGLFGDSPFGVVTFGGGSGTYSPMVIGVIREVFNNVGEYDQNHIYQAHQNACDIFLTKDGDVLSKYCKNKDKLHKLGISLKFFNPVALKEYLE